MTSLDIDFEWWRDDRGYRLIPSHPPPDDPTFGLLGNLGRSARIIRNGGNQVPYRPFDSSDRLFHIFAALGTTEDGLLEFVCRYGPLTEMGLDPGIQRGGGDDTRHCIVHAKSMHSFLDMTDEERRNYLSRFDDPGIRWTTVQASLGIGPETVRVRPVLRPPDLLAALWLELGQALSRDTAIRQCPHCGKWFEVGPGTGRRRDAKFCEDNHRVIYNSHKRGMNQPVRPI